MAQSICGFEGVGLHCIFFENSSNSKKSEKVRNISN